MVIILERIDGLMPVGREDVASTAGQALIYLGGRVVLAQRTMQSLRPGRLTFAHGAECIGRFVVHIRTLIAAHVRLMRTNAKILSSETYCCACA